MHKVAAGDLDGDGRYELIIQQPDFNTDPYQKPGYWKKSEDTYKLEAYSLDGRFLWRHDMGWSIEAGTWYAPYVVYDLDGDGKAEVYCKGGEGDPREPKGHVKTGPEWLYKLDGQHGPDRQARSPGSRDCRRSASTTTSAATCSPSPISTASGPHLLMQRGTYRAIVIEAYDPDLNLVWRWNSHDEKEKYDSQGAHTIRVADVDGDGCDEIIVGSCLVDHDGKAMWTLGIGHPDTCYVGKIDPQRPGLQIFFGIEPRQKSGAVRLVDAATGKTIWANEEPTVHVHSQGMCADILAEHPGQECYAGEAKGGEQAWMFTAQGKRIGHENIGSLAPWTLWWDADPQKEIILKGKLMKFQGETILARRAPTARQWWPTCWATGARNSSRAVNGELRIYTTTIPAQDAPRLPHAGPPVPPVRGHELDGLQHAAATLAPVARSHRSGEREVRGPPTRGEVPRLAGEARVDLEDLLDLPGEDIRQGHESGILRDDAACVPQLERARGLRPRPGPRDQRRRSEPQHGGGRDGPAPRRGGHGSDARLHGPVQLRGQAEHRPEDDAGLRPRELGEPHPDRGLVPRRHRRGAPDLRHQHPGHGHRAGAGRRRRLLGH